MTDEQWLQERRKGITATDVAAILGLSTYATPTDVWSEKTGRGTPLEDNVMLRAGRKLEPIVADYFAEETGIDVVIPDQRLWKHGDTNHYATPDRLVKGTTIPIECKAMQAFVREPSDIPLGHFLQVQWQMRVLGQTKAYYAVLTRGYAFSWFEIDYAPDTLTRVIEDVDAFWQQNVLTDTPPQPIKYEEAARRYGANPSAPPIVAHEETVRLVRRAKMAARLADQFEEAYSQAKVAIAMIMQESTRLVDAEGRTLVTWNPTKGRDTIDSKKLAAEYPEVHNAVVRTGEPSRTMRIADID